ncbi:unnamed protein product, partial [Allacma fusca]
PDRELILTDQPHPVTYSSNRLMFVNCLTWDGFPSVYNETVST